jgi:hypothetical protein
VKEINFLKKTLFWTYRNCVVEMKLRNSLKVSIIFKEVSNQEQTYAEIKKVTWSLENNRCYRDGPNILRIFYVTLMKK